MAGPAGKFVWFDLTVDNAEEVRDFYEEVIGWKPEPVPMGRYDDFNMTLPDSGDPAAGICHRRGANEDLPPVWMVYVTVADIRASVHACTQRGGSAVTPIKHMPGHGHYCVIKDPAGAVLALFEVEASDDTSA